MTDKTTRTGEELVRALRDSEPLVAQGLFYAVPLMREAALFIEQHSAPGGVPEGWRTADSFPNNGEVVLSHYGIIPVLCARMPDGETIRVVTLDSNGHFAPHGNYSPFKPSAWMPFPQPPEKQG